MGQRGHETRELTRERREWNRSSLWLKIESSTLNWAVGFLSFPLDNPSALFTYSKISVARADFPDSAEDMFQGLRVYVERVYCEIGKEATRYSCNVSMMRPLSLPKVRNGNGILSTTMSWEFRAPTAPSFPRLAICSRVAVRAWRKKTRIFWNIWKMTDKVVNSGDFFPSWASWASLLWAELSCWKSLLS